MNRETVFELKKLYEDLSSLDDKIKAMQAVNPVRDGTPLQKVTFYMWTPCFSGPTDYRPKHTCQTISAAILHDMRIERGLIITRIHSLGFETPEAPRAE